MRHLRRHVAALAGTSIVAVLLAVTQPSVPLRADDMIMPNEGGAHSDPQARPSDEMEAMSPEARMQHRFPQPVKVGFLIGLPMLDYDDSTIGFVRRVVRTPQGKVQLVINNGHLFGWGGRLIAVPIEAVAILARQIDVLDLTLAELNAAPTWTGSDGQDVPPDETIRIALGRR